MMRLITSTLSLLLIAHWVAAQGTWTEKNNFAGSARSRSVSFAIGNHAYIGTGYDGAKQLQDFWKYDPTTDTWTQVANFPGGAREDAVSFSINGKGYVGTGSSGPYNALVYHKDFWEYDPEKDTWEKVADFSGAARSSAVAFVIDDKAYVGIGYNGDYKKDLWEYDPIADKWSQKADFTGDGRTGAVAFAIDGTGYVGGGLYYNSGSPHITNNLFAYDPMTNAWSEKIFAHLYLSRQHGQSLVIDNKAYLVTGGGSDKFVSYDPQTNTLSVEGETNSIQDSNRQDAIAFTVNNQAYVGTGYHYEVFAGGNFKKDLWAYRPPHPPAAPNGLTVRMTTHTWAALAWTDNSSNETHFVVEVSNTGSDGSFTEVKTLDKDRTSTLVYTLQEIQTYYFRVKATNEVGDSDYSPIVSITVPVASPNSFTAYPRSSNEVSLQWNNPSKVTKTITVERSADAVSFVAVATLPAEATTFYEGQLTAGEKYYYRLKVESTDGQITYSSITSVIPNENLGAWIRKNNLPEEAKVGTSFSVGSKGYLIESRTKRFWEYIPETDQWKQKNDVPFAETSNPLYFVANGKAYVGSGRDGNTNHHPTRDWWSYDPSADRWVSIAQVPVKNRRYSSFSVNNRGFITHHNAVYEYDAQGDKWVKKAGLAPINFQHTNIFTLGDAAYIPKEGKVWKYTPSTDEWSELGDLPEKIAIVNTAFSLDGKGYLTTIPANSPDHYGIKNVWEYDPSTNEWNEKAALPNKTGNHLLNFVVEDNAYAICENYGQNTVYHYRPEALHTPSNLTLTLTADNQTTLTWRDHTEKENAYIVERAPFKSANFEKVATLAANVTSYRDLSASDTLSYVYRVFALSDINYSGYSGTVNQLGRPTNVATFADIGYMGIRWAEADIIAQGSIIERALGDADVFVLLDTVKTYGGSGFYRDKSIQTDELYTYRIRYLHYGETSLPAFAKGGGPLSAPAALEVTRNPDDHVELTWEDKSSVETAYVVRRGTWLSKYGDSLVPIDTLAANATSYIDADSLESSYYYYQVLAINDYNTSPAITDSILVSYEVSEEPETEEEGPVTGLEADEQATTIVVYPNPGSGLFYWQNHRNVIGNLAVYNAQGQLQKNLTGKSGTLDLRELPNGIYLLRFETREGFKSKKIIKR